MEENIILEENTEIEETIEVEEESVFDKIQGLTAEAN
jgi:hypothetical protein